MDKYILQTIYFLKKIFLENKKNSFENNVKITSEFCRKQELDLARKIGTQEGTIITSVYATSLGKSYTKKEGDEKSNNKIFFVELVLDWLNDTNNWEKSKLYEKLKKKEQYKDFFSNPENFNIDELIQKTYLINSTKNLKTKNIMLYGAPGVGKTHNYKRLITMIENGEDEKTIFDTISKNETTEQFDDVTFETIKKDKRIEFVTFHQSYSYEDFIEGFRPQNNQNIKLEDGIFKNIVNSALGKIKINEIFSINREVISERSSYIIESITNDLINIKKDRDNKIVPIPKNLLIELLENIEKGLISLDDIKNRNLDNLETKFDKYMYGYNSILHTLCKNVIEDIEYKEEKNFYIVIDEINRGNISKIFGELITLIEEDKRDSYEVTLPYSKEKFKIPSNLYIIATMNSTDKSIATIDIALRRRFTFLRMLPKESLVEQTSIKEAKDLFTSLNKHITKIINEDYQLGHSYFMNINSEEDLEFVKKYKIKPLLEEYFYGDDTNYNKAIEILNKVDNQ